MSCVANCSTVAARAGADSNAARRSTARRSAVAARILSAPVRKMVAQAPAARRSHALARTAVVRTAAAEEATASSAGSEQTVWYGLVASAEFFFNDVQNEAFAEQLRERVRFFGEQDREIDFFFVPEPAWLDAKVEKAKLVKKPAVALVSSDKVWMDFMKLRLDRVLRANLAGMPEAEIFSSASDYKLPDFDKPLGTGKWTAPYSPYEQGWWEAFYKK